MCLPSKKVMSPITEGYGWMGAGRNKMNKWKGEEVKRVREGLWGGTANTKDHLRHRMEN